MSTTLSSTYSTPHSTFAGFWRYFRFTLRHNLVRYLVWIAVVISLLAYVCIFYKTEFDTQAKLNEFAVIGSSSGMAAMIGKISSMATLGGAVWTKIWMTLAMTLSIGMVFQVTRGARADEENGRSELFRSRPLGIHSTLTAVVSGALFLCLIIGILAILTCVGVGLDPAGTGITGSVVFGLSLIACGWLGVGIGALTNQLSASASLANATGSTAIVACYALRMIGDMRNNALIWISPIGWGEKMAPWAENKGWLFILFIALTSVLITVSFMIESRRDYGSGILKDRKGNSEAKPLMLHSWGLILHLYKGSIIAWSVGMVLAGLMFGSVAKSMVDLLSNMKVPMLTGNSVTALLGLLLCFIGLVAVVLPMQIMTGLRSDEAKGLTESQLAGRMSRGRLIIERLAVACFAAVLLLLLGGLSFGASYGAVANDMSQTWRLALDALIYLPGIIAITGFVALLFGFIPRATIPVTWFLYAAMYFAVLLKDALKLPKLVFYMIPFTGTPKVPYESFNPAVLGFVAAAATFVSLGMLGLRKRDVPR